MRQPGRKRLAMTRSTTGWTTMAEETASRGEPRAARRSTLANLLSALGLMANRGQGGAVEGDGAGAAANLRTQAEAFLTITVGDVMTPRADITAVELSASFEAVVATFAESEHSRLPVYNETLDDPVGVVHLKDVFRLLAVPQGDDPRSEGRGESQPLPRLKRPTLYVPPSMRAA